MNSQKKNTFQSPSSLLQKQQPHQSMDVDKYETNSDESSTSSCEPNQDSTSLLATNNSHTSNTNTSSMMNNSHVQYRQEKDSKRKTRGRPRLYRVNPETGKSIKGRN